MGRAKFVQLFKQTDPDGTRHPLARHLLRQIERESAQHACEVGQIGFDQFMQSITVMEHGNPEQKLEFLFSLHDIDGNGSIDKIEMLEMLKVTSTAYFISMLKKYYENHSKT